KPPFCCSIACWTSSSAACLLDWSRLNWAVAAIFDWLTCSNSILTPWLADDNSYEPRTWRWSARAGLAAGAYPWKKNARNNPCYRNSSGARHRRRSDHGAEVDSNDDREDRRGAPGNRHSGIAQYGRSALVRNG